MNTKLLACLLAGLISQDQINLTAIDPTESVIVSMVTNGASLLDIKSTLDYVQFVELTDHLNTINELSPLSQQTVVLATLEQHRKSIIKSNMQRAVQKASIYLSQDNISAAYAELANIEVASSDMSLIHTKDHMILAMQETSGYMTGIKTIDERGGWLLGNMVGIIGDSGSMKTMLSLYLCVQILQNNPNFTCLYLEKEMPVKDIARRLIAYITGQSITEIVMTANSGDPSKITRLTDMIDTVYNSDPAVKSILDRLSIVGPDKFATAIDIAMLVRQHKPDIWCLDFLTMLEADDQDSYAFYKQQMDILKNTTTATNSTSIILAQIKQNALQDRTTKIPIIADAEFGSKLKQYSAYIYASFYPRQYYTDQYVSPTYFYMVGLKNRHDIPHTVPLIASPHLAQFREAKDQVAEQMKKWFNGYNSKKN